MWQLLLDPTLLWQIARRGLPLRDRPPLLSRGWNSCPTTPLPAQTLRPLGGLLGLFACIPA